MLTVSAKSIREATTRLAEFKQVNRNGNFVDLVTAVSTLREGYGIYDKASSPLVEWSEEHEPDMDLGAFLLGVIIGVMAADYEQEIEPESE